MRAARLVLTALVAASAVGCAKEKSGAPDLSSTDDLSMNADLSTPPDLTSPDLTSPDLSGADLSGADLSGADLGGADLAPPPVVLSRPSKSSTIAISDDDAIVAMVNPEDNSVSFFTTADNNRYARVTTNIREPSAVVIHPDGQTAFVANRGNSTVVKLTAIRTATPAVGTPIDVGSEPVGLALSPIGAKLFVTEYAENRVGSIDTATSTRTDLVTSIRNPRGITVTNDGDTDDSDETVVVTEFFGEPLLDGEAKNNGRQGRVRLYSTAGVEQGSIAFAPFANPNTGTNQFEATTSPNQLHAVAVNNGKIYVPSISASPALPLRSDRNVYPVIYVGDLTAKTEDTSATGTTNLADLVFALPAPRFFLGEIVDLDFKPTTNFAYAVSRAGEVVQFINYGGAATVLGTGINKQIDVSNTGPKPCQQPNGIVTARNTSKAYVNCWVTRNLAVLDLTSQNVMTVVESAPPPTAGLETQRSKGQHFFFTGRGRWSGNATGASAAQDATENGSAWSSCGSCHPDGLTDNMTWIFAAGPRQTTSMDGSFSHGAVQKRRIFNWTGIIDEMHDFEANTRGTSGGKGAVTTSATCGTLASETRSTLSAAPLGAPVTKELQNTQASNCVTNWDDIDEYAKTIRPPTTRRFIDAASVARGKDIFGDKGGCIKCHGGDGWTVSRRFFTPSQANNASTGLPATAFAKPGSFTSFASNNATQIAAQAASSDDAVATAILPPQLTCAIRNVNTFGVPGDVTKTNALEIRPPFILPGNPSDTNCTNSPTLCSNRAQGRGGYNPPSLYGLAVGAPFLHHGQAKTLEELFTDDKWGDHWRAGNPLFLGDASEAQDRADLINFLWTIDAAEPEQTVPAGFADGCQCRDASAAPVPGMECAP